MADDNKGLVAAGASLVWRRQRVLWWVYAVNLTLGLMGAAGARAQLDHLLKYSLAGEGLTKGFDLGIWFELVDRPAANLMRSAESSYLFASLFPLFMILVTGGILAVYRDDRMYSTGDFFAASGNFFWRFVRLAVFSLVTFGMLGGILWGAESLSGYVGDRTVSAMTGVSILLAGMIVVTLMALFVRLWFDIAQVRAVVQDERRMWPNLWKALGITWRNKATLFRVYLCISGLAWVTLVVGVFLWAKLPPTAIRFSFVLLQVLIVVQLLARLWQRASSITWYQRHAEVSLGDAADFTTPAPIELTEPSLPPDQEDSAAPEPA